MNMIDSCNEYKTTCTHKASYPELPIGNIPRLSSDVRLPDLPAKRRENVREYEHDCLQKLKSTCAAQSWIVNKLGGVRNPGQINAKMKQLRSMTNNKNRVVEGVAVAGKPRPGWIANAANACFAVSVTSH